RGRLGLLRGGAWTTKPCAGSEASPSRAIPESGRLAPGFPGARKMRAGLWRMILRTLGITSRVAHSSQCDWLLPEGAPREVEGLGVCRAPLRFHPPWADAPAIASPATPDSGRSPGLPAPESVEGRRRSPRFQADGLTPNRWWKRWVKWDTLRK